MSYFGVTGEMETKKKWLNDMIPTIHNRLQQILNERYFEGKKYKEIGERFGLTADQARLCAQKAIRRLKHPERLEKLKTAEQYFQDMKLSIKEN